MSDGNKRYLGDVWINEENLTRQREFFRDIIATYQYKNGGEFDASTLRGYTPSDFATSEQGILADNSLQAPLKLGRQDIYNIDNTQYIYTDAVYIDTENQCLTNTWFEDMTNNDVTAALCRIYTNVINIQEELQNDINTRVTTEEFQSIKEVFDDILEEFVDQNGHTVRKLNAQLVNGLRFILITQQAYDALSEEERNYWRNVFIIKEPEDIPSMYENPMQLTLTDGYEFQVTNGGLYVKNILSETWTQICTLDELLASSNLQNIVENIVDEYDYQINITSEDVLNALIPVSPSTINNNWQNYPFLSSSLHDNFVENVTINGTNDYITSTINSDTRFKNINIDMDTIIDNAKTDISGNINEAITPIQAQILQINNNIESIQTKTLQLESKDNSQDITTNSILTSLSNMQTQLNTLTNTVNNLNNNVTTQLNDLGNWESVFLSAYDGSNSVAGKVNRKLRICSATLNDVFSYVPRKKNTFIKTGERIASAYRPLYTVYFVSSPYTTGKIDKDGYVWGKSIFDSEYNINLNGSVMWRY